MKQFFPLYLIIFFGYIAYSLILIIFTPLFLYHVDWLLPAHFTERESMIALGIVIFLYPFGQFLSSPVLGALADKYGRRPLFIFALGVTVIVYLIIGIGVWMGSFWTIATALFAAGLSEGNVTIAHSVVADLSPPAERSRFFGYLYLSGALAYLVGPLLVAALIPCTTDCTILSFALPFFIVSALLCVTWLWVICRFKESLLEKDEGSFSIFQALGNMKNLFLYKHVRFNFLVNFLFYLAIFCFFQSFPIYIVSRYHVDTRVLSLLIAWTSIPFVIVNLGLLHYLSQRISSKQLAIYSAVVLAICLEVLLIGKGQVAIWILSFLIGMSAAICLPSIAALLSNQASQKEQGRVLGLNQSLQFFSEAVAGLAAGFLSSVFLQLSLVVSGILCCIGALLMWYAKRSFSLR